MNQIITTSIFAIVLALVALLSGFTGYKIQNSNADYLSYLNALSAGVILSAAFTHLLADAMEDLEDFDYPVAPACALAGFLLLVSVETMLTFNMSSEKTEADVEMGMSQSVRVPSTTFPIRSEPLTRRSSSGGSRAKSCDIESLRPSGRKQDDASPRASSVDAQSIQNAKAGGYLPPGEEGREEATLAALLGPEDNEEGGGGKEATSPAAAYSFWLALVVHSVMEGFAVGVSGNVVQALAILLAIVIHKIFASIALASALIDSQLGKTKFTILYGTYAFASPMGAMVAAIVSVGDSSTVPGIITGLAAGSFMYIGTMEMLPHMLNQCKNMVVAMSLFISAAVAMALLAAVV